MEYDTQNPVSITPRENPQSLEVNVLYRVPRNGEYVERLRISGGGILPSGDIKNLQIEEKLLIEPEVIRDPQNMPQAPIQRIAQLAPAPTLHTLYKQLQAFASGKPGVYSNLAQALLESFKKAGIEQRIAVLKLL